MAHQGPVFQIYGPLRRGDLPGLYKRACAQLARTGSGSLIVEVSEVAPDAVVVDAVARLELAARRHGCRVTLQGAGREMCELIELMGLTEVFLSPGAGEARTGGTAGPYPGRR